MPHPLFCLKSRVPFFKIESSLFCRASQFPSHNLILFLATQNRIKQTLREQIQEVCVKQCLNFAIPNFQIDAHEELLADLINISVHFFENNLYISPEQRHAHVKVLTKLTKPFYNFK